MAEFGAHLTSTRPDEGDSPSIFDVLAQESLVSSLKPALRHILRLLAERSPGTLGWLHVLGDEVYTLLHLVLDNYYLKHTAGSFAENFYGLKRTVLQKQAAYTYSATGKLPKTAQLKSLLFLVLVPYIKNKCDEWYEHLAEQKQAGQHTSKGVKCRLYQAFLGAYPVIHMVWEATLFSFQLAYTLGKSRYHSPYLPLAGLRLEYLLDTDQHQSAQPLVLHDKTFMQAAHLLLGRALSLLAVGVATSLSVGIFFLQFLEWWYNSEHHSTSLTALPTPPPPQVAVPECVPQLHTVCPLCSKVRTNDTTLSTTGYVFCYPCIYTYVREHHACPVTAYPAHLGHLVRLYLAQG